MGSQANGTAAVCVPVRNEAMLLPRLLDALTAQRGHPEFTLCLLFDDCSDASAAIVAERSGALPFRVVTAEAGAGPPNAGRARRAAMELGVSILRDAGAIVISTDADSAPAPDWLAANAAALADADVACGRILREGGRASPLQDRIEAYYDGLFALRRTLDPVPWEAVETHHYTSGASLALRVAHYRTLGGFEPLASAEDARLVDAAHHAGLRVRRDAAIRVKTSARREGRATGGLADHLRRLDVGEGYATMAHPEDAAWRYRRHALTRAAWGDLAARRAALAFSLGCDVDEIDRIAADCGNAEAFAMRAVPDVPGGERIVPLDEAEAALAGLADGRRTGAV